MSWGFTSGNHCTQERSGKRKKEKCSICYFARAPDLCLGFFLGCEQCGTAEGGGGVGEKKKQNKVNTSRS